MSPMTDTEWLDLHQRATTAFTPASPIVARELFSGRITQIGKVIDAINQPGLHAVLYGERGVGKTSLANIMAQLLGSAGGQFAVSKVNCDGTDTFASLCSKSLRELKYAKTRSTPGFTGTPESVIHSLADSLDSSATPNDVRVVLSGVGVPCVLVFDEFDRLKVSQVRPFTDFIKALSDYNVQTTTVIVGVASTIDQLLRDHASIERAIVQVHLPRMEAKEIQEILDKGATKLGMKFEADARDQITNLAQGLPHYAHSVGLHAVRRATSRKSVTVTQDDVDNGIRDAVENAQQSTKSLYHAATTSSHRSAIFQQVLLACALAHKDALSYFQAADVSGPLSAIMKKEYAIPAFARHLTKMCEAERGPVLERSGPERRQRYQFRNPLLEPYVVMHGLANGLISSSDLSRIKALSPKH